MSKLSGLLIGLALFIAGCGSGSTPTNSAPEAEVQAKAAEQARLNPTKNAMEVRRERENGSAPR